MISSIWEATLTQLNYQNWGIRIAKEWSALNSMNVNSKSSLCGKLKINFFRAAVESILLYGSTTWTKTAAMKKKIDGTYTRMLHANTNTSWKDHITNQQLYGNFHKASVIIQTQRLRFAGHCWRNKKRVGQ